jgi:fructan beta-fructosidase
MAVVIPNERKIRFYASPNLKNWELLSDFSQSGTWSDSNIWECPDLFPLQVEGEPGVTKWVLIVSIVPGAPAGGSGMQYFVGDFDGKQFTADPSHPTETALWLDYGSDFYAAVTWSNIPESDGRRILIGWMNNWNYARDIPTSPWRGAMSMPRSLTLARTEKGLRLIQKPVDELNTLRRDESLAFSGGTFSEAAEWLSQRTNLSELLDVEMRFSQLSDETPFQIKIATSAEEYTALEVDPKGSSLVLDRSHSGLRGFHSAFSTSTRHEAPITICDGGLAIRFLLDVASVEAFAQDGETVLTEQIFQKGAGRSISIDWKDGSPCSLPTVDDIKIHILQPALTR